MQSIDNVLKKTENAHRLNPHIEGDAVALAVGFCKWREQRGKETPGRYPASSELRRESSVAEEIVEDWFDFFDELRGNHSSRTDTPESEKILRELRDSVSITPDNFSDLRSQFIPLSSTAGGKTFANCVRRFYMRKLRQEFDAGEHQ